jgi:hypothetical protein
MAEERRLDNILATLSNHPDSVTKAMRILVAKLRASEDDDPDVVDALETLQEAYNIPIDEKIKRRLASFETYCDGRDLQPLLDKLEGQITDFTGAINALDGFSLSWFQGLALSNEAKQRVAGVLNELVTKYGHTTNPFWVKLIEGDTEVLDAVSFDTTESPNFQET